MSAVATVAPRCIWLCKDTNLKANHNCFAILRKVAMGVYDSAKILIWKQITTVCRCHVVSPWCIWLCKDTNLKANHNWLGMMMFNGSGVYDSAKILIWKQITTVLECIPGQGVEGCGVLRGEEEGEEGSRNGSASLVRWCAPRVRCWDCSERGHTMR